MRIRSRIIALDPTMKILIVFGTAIATLVILYLLLISFCDWHAISCVMLDGFFPNLISVGLLPSFIIPSAWACSLTEEGVKRFEQLCPTKSLNSDCTCNIYGVSVDVLGNGVMTNVSSELITMITIVGVVGFAVYFMRKRKRSQLKYDN